MLDSLPFDNLYYTLEADISSWKYPNEPTRMSDALLYVFLPSIDNIHWIMTESRKNVKHTV